MTQMRAKKKTLIWILTVLTLAAAVIVLLPRVYLTFDGAHGTILWNANEAYLFIDIRRFGHEMSAAGFPLFRITSQLGVVQEANDESGRLIVIRVSGSEVSQHEQGISYRPPGSEPGQYTPRQGRIYANYPGLGGLCFWAADHFEPASPEQRRGFNGINGLTQKDFDIGWASREFTVGSGDVDDVSTINVGSAFRLVLSDLGSKDADRTLTVDLLRPGQRAARIWSVDLHWGRIRGMEYRRIFTKA
jgi:hypothetical protein